MIKKSQQKILSKIASKKDIKQNSGAFKLYSYYKKTSDLLDRADIALGRKLTFKQATGSTFNFEINQHGIASTTASKI